MTKAQALKQSIAHWQRMLKLSVEDIKNKLEYPSWSGCALCKLYFIYHAPNCYGCPVKDKTGLSQCKGTPYLKVLSLYTDISKGKSLALKTFHKPVQKEIDFLGSVK